MARTPGTPGTDRMRVSDEVRPGGPCDVLFLAAFGPELAPLQPALGDAGTMAGRIGDVSVAARTCGIGLPAAAAFAALHIQEMRPAAVVLLGTCGAYPALRPDGAVAERGLAIGEVVVSRRVLLVDPIALEGKTQFPDAMAAPIDAAPPLLKAFVALGTHAADMATTLAITVDDEVAARIAEATGAGVEHLEAYGVATACAAQGVAFAAVLGIANAVGARGRAEWRSHHHRASAAAVAAALRWVKEGAMGRWAGDREPG
jgi:nucleoside phosphorylase